MPVDAFDANLTNNLAEVQTSAASKFTVDDKLAYGTAIKVGDKTY